MFHMERGFHRLVKQFIFLSFGFVSEQVDTKKAILAALEDKKGIVTEACKSIGLSRSTYYDWLNTDPEFKKAVVDIQETAIDYVEGKLFQKISGVLMGKSDGEGAPVTYELAPSDTAIIFYLKTKAKHRGYIEKTEMDLTSLGERITGFNYLPPNDNRTDQNSPG